MGVSSEKQFVASLKEKDSVASIFLATEKSVMTDKNGKPYMSLNLQDSSGSINAKIWEKVDDLDRLFQSGDYVFVKGHVQVFQSRRQIVVHDLRLAPQEQITLRDFLPTSQADPEKMLVELEAIVAQVQHHKIRRLLELTLADQDIRWRLMQSPAAKSIHHAFLGGLLEHTLSVAKTLVLVSQNYPFLNRDLLVFGAIYHDLGKIWELTLQDGIKYTEPGRLVGHMVMAVETIERLSQQIPEFSQKLKDVLKHIVLSHHGKLEYGSPKEPVIMEAIVVAMIDDLDAKLGNLVQFFEQERAAGAKGWTKVHPQMGRYLMLDPLSDT